MSFGEKCNHFNNWQGTHWQLNSQPFQTCQCSDGVHKHMVGGGTSRGVTHVMLIQHNWFPLQTKIIISLSWLQWVMFPMHCQCLWSMCTVVMENQKLKSETKLLIFAFTQLQLRLSTCLFKPCDLQCSKEIGQVLSQADIVQDMERPFWGCQISNS